MVDFFAMTYFNFLDVLVIHRRPSSVVSFKKCSTEDTRPNIRVKATNEKNLIEFLQERIYDERQYIMKKQSYNLSSKKYMKNIKLKKKNGFEINNLYTPVVCLSF